MRLKLDVGPDWPRNVRPLRVESWCSGRQNEEKESWPETEGSSHGFDLPSTLFRHSVDEAQWEPRGTLLPSEPTR